MNCHTAQEYGWVSETTVDRNSPVPMWHQIEVALTRDIGSGLLPPGAQLPNEAEIAARFGVHRHTARRALATLAEKGAVRIRRGLGTFVERPLIDYPITERTRFTATLQQQNRTAAHELLESRTESTPADVAQALGIPPGVPATLLRTVGLADGVPVNVAATWFPASRFPDLSEIYREVKSITATLERYGLGDYRRRSTSVTAGLPSEEDAALLQQTRRDPVLVVESVDEDSAGVAVSFSRVRFAADRVQILVK